MQYIIFGTGDYYERYKKWFDKKDIVALIDNSPAKQNTFIDGIEVLAPEIGIQRKYDVIVILSFYVKEMKQQLLGFGVAEKKIYHFYDLNRLFQKKIHYFPVQYFDQAKTIAEADKTRFSKILFLLSSVNSTIRIIFPPCFAKQNPNSIVRRGIFLLVISPVFLYIS